MTSQWVATTPVRIARTILVSRPRLRHCAGVQPANPRGEWSHESVQSQFNGLLVNRRKLYPASLRRVLRDAIEVREKADYTASGVNERVARRVLQQAQEFCHAVRENVV